MRHWKPFTLPAIWLTALIVLLARQRRIGVAHNRRHRPPNRQSPDRANSDNRCRGKTSATFGHRTTSRTPGSGPFRWRAGWHWRAWHSRLGAGIIGVANRAAKLSVRNRARTTRGSPRVDAAGKAVSNSPSPFLKSSAITSRNDSRSARRARTTEEFLHDLLNHSDALLTAISRCWRIFSTTATWPSSPAGTLRRGDGDHAPERAHLCHRNR